MKPWEMNWDVKTESYDGSFLQSDNGEDVKPFEKLNYFLQNIGGSAKKSDKSFSDLTQDFLKNITTFEVKELSPEKKEEIEQRVKEVSDIAKKATEGDVEWKEPTKALARGTLEQVKGIGGLTRAIGDWWSYKGGSEDLLPSEKKTLDLTNWGAKSLEKTGQWLEDLADMGLNSDILQQDPEIFKGSFTENPSLTRTLSTVASGIPSLGVARGLSAVTNPVFGVAVLSGIDTQDIYWGAKEEGKTPDEAMSLFTIGAVGTYKLEKIGFDSIFGKKVVPLAEKIASGMISEGLTEGAQTIYQNAIKKIGYDATQDLFEGVVESVIAGAGSGGISASIVGLSSKLTNAETALKEQGYTQDDINVMEEAIGTEMVNHKDSIEAQFQENVNKSLDELGKIKEKFANMPEEQRMRISKELEEGFGKYYEELSKIMPEEQARSNAALIRNQAFFMSDLMGISPKEYFDNYGPKIKKATFGEFENRGMPTQRYELSEEDIKNAPIPQVTQKDINYAKSHPEWKRNAEIIDMIGKAGVDINDDLSIINKALRQYSLEDYRFRKEQEKNHYDYLNSKLSEQDQERFATMVEDGMSADDAYAQITGTASEEYIPFQEQIELAENMQKLDNIYPAYEGETITINGQEKTVYNSNGDRIAKSKEALENFWKWFGDSKVVDGQGRPLVVYHGTYAEFDTFNKNMVSNYSAYSKNFYFTENKQRATDYGNKILSVYLKSDNLFDVELNLPTREDIEKINTILAKDGLKLEGDYGFDGMYMTGENFLNDLGVMTEQDYDYLLKEIGYDGIKSKDEFIVFKPNQIKSTSNRGTYSESENIYYQSAFAGSRVDYDRPSLEAIGSGEGAQAHGWGLYYALNKDVADRYRDTFTKKQYSYVFSDKSGKLSAELSALLSEQIHGAVLFNVTESGNFSELRNDLKNTIEYLEKPDETSAPIIADGEKIIAAINANPKISVSNIAKLSETLKQPYRWKSVINAARKTAKSENRTVKASDVLKMVEQHIAPFVRENLANKELAKELKQIDIGSLTATRSKGQVHEVDIPESPYLIDEQKALSEQSDFVKAKLEQMNAEGAAKGFLDSLRTFKTDDNIDGRDIYQKIAKYMNEFILDDDGNVAEYNDPFKQASQLLAENGIKGITYDGRRDGRCFVIFNDKDVKVIQKFYQGEQDPRGAYVNDVIYLFESANESTLPHELSHRWDRELRTIAEETGNERVKGMLEQVDSWEESEFKRKYKVTKRDNGYAVVNKKGEVVYDNRGNGFLSEQDAIDYAKKELFARGFEQYLREGKAPNNSLKQAFRNFFMWLKKLYRDAMDLNIQLSPDIKNVYADILGGTDIDFFLDSTPESFIQQRIKLGEEKEAYLDGIITDAVANKKQVIKNKGGKGFSDVWTKAMIPLSTRAKRISPKLRNVLRKYEFTLSNELNKKYAKVTPFMNIWKNMEENDAIAFDLALKNDYVKKQLEIVDKYNARKEWEAVRETLENIYDDAINAGLDINWRPDYFPRKVKDVDGFLSYIHNVPEWTRFQQAINEAGLGGATAQEQAEFINKYLRGFVKVDLMPNKYGSEKERKIEVVDNELNQFYAPSIESLVSYIEGLNSRIVSSKYLGRGADIEESIGGYMTYLLNNNIIDPSQIDEVRDILRARFDARGVSNRWLANARNYSYMYTMGGINSAITQIEDLSVAMYKAGVWNTLTTAMESKKITKKDLGLQSISAEFVEQSKSGQLLNKMFKLTGLDAIDSFGKETLVNAELKKFQKMSDETLKEYIEPIMEGETDSTIKDIKEGNISDNVLYLMFSELSDVQPISLSELPEFYNRGGNLRILYMLKSFAVKRIDIFRNECFDKIKNKDFNIRKQGMQNLFTLASLMILCGASKDWLIDLIYGRDIDMSETLVNNILGLAGISKFQIYQAKEKGFTSTIKDMIFPPIYSFLDDLISDVSKISQGKREIKDMEVLKGIPLVGRFYYWWIGRGKEKGKKKKRY